MTYRPIADYGVIGDMHSAALVSGDGSIDWLCFPRFSSPSVFAAILDDGRGGRFRIRPAGDFRAAQRYLTGTNVLELTYETSGGRAVLTDFMPVGSTEYHCPHELVRILECRDGSLEVDIDYEPRLDYARDATTLAVAGQLVTASKGADRLFLVSSVPLEERAGSAGSRVTLRRGDRATFVLHWDDEAPHAAAYSAPAALDRTTRFWRGLAEGISYRGVYQHVVRRSALALALLVYAPTGAICAAATTSLPEQIGGGRNWDYRFAWPRDAAFTLDVFNRLRQTEYTRPFLNWLAPRLEPHDESHSLHALYPIEPAADDHDVEEQVLEHLEGYRGSRPVRIGNAAYHQTQLDVYGEIMFALESYQRAGGHFDDMLWKLARLLVEEAIARWREPDNGIWEFRTEPRHFTYSKVMCWAAVDRGLRLAGRLRKDVDYARWRAARDEIKERVLKEGWNARKGSFTQYFGGDSLDASLLFLPMVGFLPGHDPRVVRTIDAIRDELSEGGLIRRYIPEHADDGLDGEEGTFTMCSLWLAGALIAAGRVEEAREVFERVVALGNHLGVYSEMLDGRTGTYLGNYPQAFTHIALIHTARNLDLALARRRGALPRSSDVL